MIYIPQALTDAWLMEDIQGGDLTTRALGTGNQAGIMEFRHRQGGCVSGIAPAAQMLRSLGLTVTARLEDGAQARPGEVLLRATGRACALQQGWKAVQNVLEWSCGVSAYVAQMLALLHTRLPNAHIACTRKAIPGTRLLGTQAIVAAGGLIHRAGSAETLLLFANHRRFLTDDGDWAHAIDLLRRRSPEKKWPWKPIRRKKRWLRCEHNPTFCNLINLRLSRPARSQIKPAISPRFARWH